MHACILAGRDTPYPLEVAGEMTLIGETDLSGGIRRGGAGAQQGASPLDAQLQLVGVRRNPRMERERPHQVKAAEPRQCGEFVETDRLVEILVQVLLGALDCARCLGVASRASPAGMAIILNNHCNVACGVTEIPAGRYVGIGLQVMMKF